MIHKTVDVKLNAKPLYMGLYHEYVFEGPCRMGTGHMLTTEYDMEGISKKIHAAEDNIEKRLAGKVNLLSAYTWNYSEEFRFDDARFAEMTADASDVDVYLIPAMSRFGFIVTELARQTKKPIVLIPPLYLPTAMGTAAALRARGMEVYAARSWEETIDLIEVLTVRKALGQTKVLCAARFGSSKTPSVGDNLIDPDMATAKLGIQFRYVNCHELLDQTDLCDSTDNHTLPGRRALNPTAEDVKEIERMTDELIAGADECHMAREEVFHSFRAYYTIRKLLDHYGCNAFCAPCPDMCATRRLNEERYTFCMNHSLLNEVGIPSACEYDMCALVSLVILENFAKAGAYMGNCLHTPYSITQTGRLFEAAHYNLGGNCDTSYHETVAKDPENTLFVLHAAPNRKLHGFDEKSSPYSIRPFTGSGWGVTLRHDFNADIGTTVTLCRLDPSCGKLFVAKGEIVAGRGQDDNGCSLGVFLHVKDGNDFFQKQLDFGNHMALAYGDYFDRVCMLGKTLDLEVVTA